MVLARNGSVLALDPRDGEVIWEIELSVETRDVELWIGEAFVLAIADVELSMIRYPEGEIAWSVTLSEEHYFSPRPRLEVSQGQIYVVTEGHLYSFDLDGKELWKRPIPGSPEAANTGLSFGFPGSVQQSEGDRSR